MPINYLKGDATAPQAKGNKIIAHICNTLGGWGRGFVEAISARWEEPEKAYRAWHRNKAKNDFGLGNIQVIQVEPYIWVVNMIAQQGLRAGSKGPPIRYEALHTCLENLALKTIELHASIHMPKIGTGIAGGKWDKIEKMIEEVYLNKAIQIYIYDY